MPAHLHSELLEYIVECAIQLDARENSQQRALALRASCPRFRILLSPTIFRELSFWKDNAGFQRQWQRMADYADNCAISLNKYVKNVTLVIPTECETYQDGKGGWFELPDCLRRILSGIREVDKLDITLQSGTNQWPPDPLADSDFAAILDAIGKGRQIHTVKLQNSDGSCYRFECNRWLSVLGTARTLDLNHFMPADVARSLNFSQLANLTTFEARFTLLPLNVGMTQLTSCIIQDAFNNDIVALDMLLRPLAQTLTFLSFTKNNVWLREGYLWQTTLTKLKTLVCGKNRVGHQGQADEADMGICSILAQDTPLVSLAVIDNPEVARQALQAIPSASWEQIKNLWLPEMPDELRAIGAANTDVAILNSAQEFADLNGGMFM